MRKLVTVLGLAFAASIAVAGGDDAADPERPKLVSPFVPTHAKVVTAMLKTAGIKKGETVYDLGCGDGRIVIEAVKEFGAGRGIGIDFYPARLKDCEKAVAGAGMTHDLKKTLTFKQGDVLKLTADEFAGVDVVTLYLLPAINRELKPVLKAGLKKGARVVSHDFDMGDDWQPEKTILVEADRTHTIYPWTIK